MPKLKIAVIGSGVSGLSCAWLLSQRHDVTVYESESRLGGHANTVDVRTAAGPVSVDTGFIVFNTWSYPNFTAMMDYLDQPIVATQMSFSISAEQGRYEYSGEHLGTLFGTARQWASPRHWRMMADLVRFYRKAEQHAPMVPAGTSIGQYLEQHGYSDAFVQRHILPMAGAIWSATPDQIADYPFHAFIRFFSNHKLFELGNRPDWQSVQGGSRQYVSKLVEDAKFAALVNSPVQSVARTRDGVVVASKRHGQMVYDQVVLATHGDACLDLITDPSEDESALLGVFKTSANRVYLHRDAALMPATKRFWSAWNYRLPPTGRAAVPEVTYWMNALQKLNSPDQHFVSLNPHQVPAPDLQDGSYFYRHPIFNAATLDAQQHLWSLQGRDRLWFCGAWFGSGFHEDGLQAGLSVAEHLGGVRRPWHVKNESSRIHLGERALRVPPHHLEAAE